LCRLKAGQVLFEEDDEGNGCYRVEKGVVKVSLASPQGGERIIAVFGEGGLVGDLALIDGLPRSATVTALTDCEFRLISRESFEAFAKRRPEIYKFFMELLAARLRDADDTISALAFLTAKGRVASALLELAETFGKNKTANKVEIPNVINQKDLAALAGVSRENTNRILTDWQRRRILTKSGKSYRVNDIEKLRRELNWDNSG
jgi:CRP/FNR family cyclic AMP-dependent transcriptional regulator